MLAIKMQNEKFETTKSSQLKFFALHDFRVFCNQKDCNQTVSDQST